MHNNISGFEIKLYIFYVWIHTSFWDYFQNCLWGMKIPYVDHLLLKQSFLYFIKFHSTAASFHASFQNLIDFSIFTFHVLLFVSFLSQFWSIFFFNSIQYLRRFWTGVIENYLYSILFNTISYSFWYVYHFRLLTILKKCRYGIFLCRFIPTQTNKSDFAVLIIF